jgi:hypothetical protein
MERRRAIAWAGSIAMIGSISAFAFGSLVGGFGLGPSPAPETRVDGSQLIPGDTQPGPARDRIPTGPAPKAAERGPASKSPATAGADPRSPAGGRSVRASLSISPVVATADLDDGSGSQVGLAVPCAPVIATTASTSHSTETPSGSVASMYSKAGDPAEPATEMDTTQPGSWNSATGSEKPLRVPARDSSPPQKAAVNSMADRPGLSIAQGKKSASGRLPGSDGKPGKGHRAVDGAGGRGG